MERGEALPLLKKSLQSYSESRSNTDGKGSLARGSSGTPPKKHSCPECGHRDPTIWHTYRWITDMFQCRFEDFIQHYPWQDLEPGQIVEDEHYFYRRTSKRNGGAFVQRWPKVLGREYYKSRFFERFKVPRDFGLRPGQKQIDLTEPSP